jgi:hypothetical protein
VAPVVAPVVVLVEGASDAAVVEELWRRREPSVTLDVRDLRGITNVGRHLDELVGRATVLGLCDAPEERFVVRALARHGYAVDGRSDLERIGFQVCDRDLEDELIRALGPAGVEVVLEQLGELVRFRAFQNQPQWRGIPVAEQLHRFAGTASGRKLRLARGLAQALGDDDVPPPLARLVAGVAGALQP